MQLPIADNRETPSHGQEHAGAVGASGIENDLQYAQLLVSMQRGQWQEAADALASLEGRYPGAPELGNVRLSLALRLSAEESWSGRARQAVTGSQLPIPLIRALAIADLALYAIVVLLLLLSRMGL